MFGRKKYDHKIYPDEIFLDSRNVSGFDTSHFEGRLEKPISKKIFVYLAIFMSLFGLFFISRIFFLQVFKGEEFLARSNGNNLKKESIPSLRGAIYDRNGIAMSWNGEAGREYGEVVGSGHVLGYVGIPTKEILKDNKNISSDEIVGKDGIEEWYDKFLRGVAGVKLTEKNSQGSVISESVQIDPKNGDKITLTIDSKIQSYLYLTMEKVIKDKGFEGGSAVILDINDGSVLAMTNFPEYNPKVFSDGGPTSLINSYINNKNKPFINRAVSGLYAPGSIVKPLMALAALNEKTISPDKKILSAGSISIQNPFFPDKKTVFKDWKAHGWVDMRHALAISSDVYFYEIGGGFEDINGLGINKIYEYAKRFGLGDKTGIDLGGEKNGVVPSQQVKEKNNPSDPTWRVGDTYISAIGQGYFLTTPIEMAVYTASIANNGKIITPKLVKNENFYPLVQPKNINIPEEYFKIVKEGMRMVVTEGTAQGLNYPDLKIAAKTGTAEVGGSKNYIHSWIIGFYPYENPKYAFAMVLEKGPAGNTTGAPYVMNQFFNWLKLYHSEYVN
ncbi:MAG: penicillin-binding transpeptidase domain-containing protein [Patescibacteria group bacterium]